MKHSNTKKTFSHQAGSVTWMDQIKGCRGVFSKKVQNTIQ